MIRRPPRSPLFPSPTLSRSDPPRPGRSCRLGLASLPTGVVGALPVPFQVLEHPDQRPLPQLASPPWRDLQPPTLSNQQAGPLQGALDLLQPSYVVHGVLSERAAESLLVDVLQGRPGVVGPHGAV